MGSPAKGKADYLALGDYNAACFECGRKFKASEMQRYWQGYWLCQEHWNPRQPQDFVRGVPDNMTVPWSQFQVLGYPQYVENVGGNTGTATVEEVEILIDTSSATAADNPIIINVFGGATLESLVITDGTGDGYIIAPSIVLNNYGVIDAITNNSSVPITYQGTGSTPGISMTLVAALIPPASTEVLYGYSVADVVGSLTPTTHDGETINIIASGLDRFGQEQSLVQFAGTGLTQSFFTSLTINGVTLLSSTASYTDTGTVCQWSWQLAEGAPWYFGAGTYTVVFA